MGGKAERNPKSEGRKQEFAARERKERRDENELSFFAFFAFLHGNFGFLSAFGLRPSDLSYQGPLS
jgi:hypothetical protein